MWSATNMGDNTDALYPLAGLGLTENLISLDREVVDYASNPAYLASYRAYYLLQSLGLTNLRRFVGWMNG